jgi:hypothetical protein
MKSFNNIRIFAIKNMKTTQLMQREFLGSVIDQRTDNGYFNATSLLLLYNEKTNQNKRFADFWENNQTKEFLQALVNELNSNNGNLAHLGTSIKMGTVEEDLFITKRGNKGSTFMHPYLFIEFAAWLNAEFRVKLYKWIYDNLIDFRNQAGDYYKEMCLAINEKYLEFYDKKPDPLLFIKEANYLNQLVFGENKGHRNDANEIELALMNRLQKANIKMIKEGKAKIERYKILRDIAIYN